MPPPPDPARPRRWPLAVLFVVAVAVRLGAAAALTGLSTPPAPGSDVAEYDAVAWNLLQGNGYVGVSPDVKGPDGQLLPHVTAYRPPTPVFFYLAVYAVAGHSYPAGHAAQAVLGGLTVLVLWAIGRRVFGPAAGWVAGAAYAVYPTSIYYSLALLSEAQAAFLVALLAWLCLGVKGPRGGWWAAAAGLGLGVFLLCKPGYVFLFPLLPLWAWAVAGRDRRLWLRAALIPVVAGLVVLPWAARNFVALGAPIPFGTGGGSLLLQANNRVVVADPLFHGYAVWDTCLPEYAPAIREPNDEVRRDAAAKQLAVGWLKENPDKWFYLARGKVWRLFTPAYFGKGDRERAAVNSAGYGAVLVGFLLGIGPVTVWMLRRRDPALILQALILATAAVAVVFHGQHRYRFPVDGLMLVIASGTVVWLVRAAAGRERLPRVPPARAAAGVLAAGTLAVG
ncbi:MAG: glycosyltransferase family 39 protein, partial [Gemmataceae bacterium]|nr:glycosyltransferase family 39 protein [Gemmataceae bacterium]